MKRIAFYFSNPEPLGYPFHKKEYFEGYSWIKDGIEQEGIDVVIVRFDSYLGEGKFSHGWKMLENQQVEEVPGPFKVDLIFDRDMDGTIPHITDCKVVDCWELNELCRDKLATSAEFPEFSPLSFGVNSFEEAQKTLPNFGTYKYIVLKKNFLAGGEKIHICKPEEVTEDLYKDWSNIIIQEFLDTSVGVPGVIGGRHDIRINIVNHRATNSVIRVPKRGEFLANISQGASGFAIDMDQVPAEILEMVKVIIDRFKKYGPSVYAADFLNTPKGHKLVEINSRPGVGHPIWTRHYKDFNDAIVKMLVEAVNS